jgi:putative efflux protein, MATE family
MNTSKELMKYSLPAMLENILQASLGLIDSLFIAQISLVAVTAVGLVNGILAVYQAVFIALGVAVSTIISSLFGSHDKVNISKESLASIKLAIIFGLLLGFFSLFLGHPLLVLLGADQDVINQALPFFRITAGTSILMVLLTVMGSLIRATGDNSGPLYINILVNILNVIFNGLLIFGYLGFPKLGIVGAGIASSLARLIGVIVLFHRLQTSPAKINIGDFWQKSPYKQLLRRAIPIMGERLTMRLGDLVIFAIVISYGSQIFAGNSIGETISSYNYLPTFGMATGLSVLVSYDFGEKNYKAIKKITNQALKITILLSTSIGAIIYFAGPNLSNFFTDKKEVIAASMLVLLVSFISEPVVSGVLIYTSALQAIGDVKTPFLATSFGMWLIRICLGYILGTVCHLELLGVWLAVLLDNSFRCLYLRFIYRKKLNLLSMNED